MYKVFNVTIDEVGIDRIEYFMSVPLIAEMYPEWMDDEAQCDEYLEVLDLLAANGFAYIGGEARPLMKIVRV